MLDLRGQCITNTHMLTLAPRGPGSATARVDGPIVVGEGTKITAACVLSRIVPPRSIVEAPVPHVSARAPRHGV